MALCSCSWPGAIVFWAMQHRPRPTGWQLLAGSHFLGRSRDRGKGLLLQLPTGRRKSNLPALASRTRGKLLLFQWEPLGNMVAVYRLLCGWGRVHGFYWSGHWAGTAWTSKIGNTDIHWWCRGNTFRITGSWGRWGSTDHHWIPITKGQ